MGGRRASSNRSIVPGLGPSDADLDFTNARLRECARVGDLQAFVAEGEIILRDIFCGDVAAWESRSPVKMHSIRRLARRPRAPYKKDALAKRIGVYVAMKKLAFVWRSPGITASHVVEVLRLSHDERVRMLELVQAEGWSVRQLHAEVVHHRRTRGERRGRRASPHIRKALAVLRKATQTLSRVPALLEHGAIVDDRSRSELAMLVDQLAVLQRRLETALTSLPVSSARARKLSNLASIRSKQATAASA